MSQIVHIRSGVFKDMDSHQSYAMVFLQELRHITTIFTIYRLE